jgi:hypothetical protein
MELTQKPQKNNYSATATLFVHAFYIELPNFLTAARSHAQCSTNLHIMVPTTANYESFRVV